MPDKMIERVARALYRQGDTGPYGQEDEDAQWHQFVGDARVAIAAMREPTETMVDAFLDTIVSPREFREETLTRMWNAGIDAALAEEG
jgi:hypothetical protein